jgi:mono/diheme cytochrome c family protein
MIETGQPPASPNAYHSLPNRCRANAVYALSGLATLVIALPVNVWASQPVDAQTELIAHGKYIVQGVGMCADCHTPRGSDGQPIKGQELHGASLQAMAHPPPGWTSKTPKIAGLPAGYTEAELTTFLETGRTRAGTSASPPMPPYRMNVTDARAVAAYLHSLN